MDDALVEKVALTPERVAAAIKATQYKYFGDYEMSDDQREAVETLVAFAIANAGAEPIVAPVNGESDPEWAAIRRAIDQFVGRIPSISKHRALHNSHLKAVVDRLDAAGDREAADTIVWQAWYRALDRERERFLLDDARTNADDLRLAGVKEGLEMAAKECDGLATTAAAIQCNLELSGYAAPIKAMQRETAEALATAIRSLGPRP